MRGGLFALAAMAFLLTGCAGGQFVGLHSCAKDGSVVWYVMPNAQGHVDTSIVSPANCEHGR